MLSGSHNNNNIKKRIGMVVGAAAVHLCPTLSGTGAQYGAPPPSSLDPRKFDMTGVPRCGLVEGPTSTCGDDKATPACFYEATVNLISLESNSSAR